MDQDKSLPPKHNGAMEAEMGMLDYQNGDNARREMGVFRSLFGPSRKEVWKQLAEQIGGNFADTGLLGRSEIVATIGPWRITLDTFRSDGEESTTYTRLRAPYVSKDGFRLSVCRAGFLTALLELFGRRDIRIGDAAFDQAFVIKSNMAEKVRLLLSNPELRRQIMLLPDIRIEVRDDDGWCGTQLPRDVDELYFAAAHASKNLDRLRGLFELFSAMLHQLHQIGSAGEDDPKVTLSCATQKPD
jgi:hypothetical protein